MAFNLTRNISVICARSRFDKTPLDFKNETV